MERIPVTSGAYQSRAILSGAQRCVNLFPQANDDPQAPVPVTHFPTPGLKLKAASPIVGANRGMYRVPSTGKLYTVIRNKLYYVNAAFQLTELGTLNNNFVSPVSMVDNGIVLLIVDGTQYGYAVNLVNHAFAQVSDPNFLGWTRADFADGFLFGNIVGTNSWQISLAFVTFANLTAGTINPGSIYAAFDPLDIVAKIGASDGIATLIAMHRDIFLIGNGKSSEAWYNSGAADFPYAIVPGTFFQHGTPAPYSLAKHDLAIFFLSIDEAGSSVVARIKADLSYDQISTRGIEYIVGQMGTISDAIGGVYQQGGQAFYVLQFPTENRTFACELKSLQWHELAWTDTNTGMTNRHRSNSWCFAYGINLVGDWQNGNIYQLDPLTFSDAGAPITRIRTIPHTIANGESLRADWIVADLQGGTLKSADDVQAPPKVFIRVSTDRGGSFSDPQEGVFGAAGDYAQFPAWRNLGLARDFVFELSWDAPINTKFDGLFIRGTKAIGDG